MFDTCKSVTAAEGASSGVGQKNATPSMSLPGGGWRGGGGCQVVGMHHGANRNALSPITMTGAASSLVTKMQLGMK